MIEYDRYVRGSSCTVSSAVDIDSLFDRFKSVRGKTSELDGFDEVSDKPHLEKGCC